MSKKALFRKENKSKKQENRLAKKYNGKPMPASGAFPGFKSDVEVNHKLVRIEAKNTGKKTFTLKLVDLEKIEREALPNGQIPLLVVELGGREWGVVPIYFIDEFLKGE